MREARPIREDTGDRRKTPPTPRCCNRRRPWRPQEVLRSKTTLLWGQVQVAVLVGTASLRRASPRRRYPDYDRYKDWPAAAWTLYQCTEPLLPLYPGTLARRYRAPRRGAEVFPRSGAQPSRLALRLRFIKPNEAHDLAAILAALSRVGLTPSISCSD